MVVISGSTRVSVVMPSSLAAEGRRTHPAGWSIGSRAGPTAGCRSSRSLMIAHSSDDRGSRTVGVLWCADRPRRRGAIKVTSVAIGPTDQLDPRLLEHRRELTGYCYRLLGSSFDADDAVHETMVRAWRGLSDFEGRSALRSWLYRIATNVCLDQLSGRQRRALPMDLSGTPYPPVEQSLAARRPGTAWVEPILDRQVVPDDVDPAEQIVLRESIRLAFVAALQHLPPRQRAVLLLRDVLRWKADEVAELLDTTTAAVNSALQRAHATLADAGGVPEPQELHDDDRALLDRYVDAFERYDVDGFVRLLRKDATQHMP